MQRNDLPPFIINCVYLPWIICLSNNVQLHKYYIPTNIKHGVVIYAYLVYVW